MSKRHFLMMAAYNRWANERIYAAAETLPDEEWRRNTGAFFGSLMATLNHILVADRIWLHRFTREGSAPNALDVVLHADFPGLKAARESEDRRIVTWLEGLAETDIEGRFSYTTVSDMRTISQRLEPALVHFFNHQTHHRGQAHAILTTLGRPSVVLDLIGFLRTEDGRPYA
ncbi:MAG: damage-inducible protein DinB [Methylobacterium mesophilicum]|nr:damage-inducible protein DinB [Methylobacterium mesophilicum]